MGKRRKARELTLEALYRVEIAGEAVDVVLEDIFSHVGEQEVRSYTERLTKETLTHLEEIDRMIGEIAANWDLSRIAVIDKNILRFAICELLHFEDVPLKVTIDEAIEIAKKYSTPDSGRFVNGILDRVAKQAVTEAPKTPDDPSI